MWCLLPFVLASALQFDTEVLASTEEEGCDGVVPPDAEPAVPLHVAVIMDGNRRFGQKELGNKLAGHTKGAETLSKVVEWSMAAGVKILTAYAFSTENWNRPKEEVDLLMGLFVKYLKKMLSESSKQNVRFRVLVSDPEMLPADVVKSITEIEEKTAQNTGFQLNLAVSYGSRSEITGAARKLAQAVAAGEMKPEDITEEMVGQNLLTAGQPDPDLMVRTSGEQRLSNYLLWQLAYTEMVFIEKTWPELTQDDLLGTFQTYSQRKRRFGK